MVRNLGRGLISTHPKPEASELEHCKEVCGELVIAGGDAPEVFDLVKEAFDQITVLVQIRAEAYRVFPVTLGRDVGPAAAVPDEVSDPIGIITAISEQQGFRFKAMDEFWDKAVVMSLACRKSDPDR